MTQPVIMRSYVVSRTGSHNRASSRSASSTRFLQGPSFLKRSSASLRRGGRGVNLVRNVISPDADEDFQPSNGPWFKEDSNDADLLSAMQTMAGTMQRKLNSLNKVLDEANKAKARLEEELSLERSAAKETRAQLEAELADVEREVNRLRELRQGLNDEVASLRSSLTYTESKLQDMSDLKKQVEVTLINEREAIERTLTMELQGVQQQMKNMKREFDNEVVSAVTEVEERTVRAKKQLDNSQLRAAKQTIQELKTELSEAIREVTTAQSSAEVRVNSEVAAMKNAEQDETQMLAMEAQMAADAAVKRAMVAEMQLKHQKQLMEVLKRLQADKAKALEDMEEMKHIKNELDHKVTILMNELEESRKRMIEAEACASSASAAVEEKSARIVQDIQDKLTVVIQERDAALSLANAKAEAAAAATKRAEAAEVALRQQDDVIERCMITSEAEETARVEAIGLKEKIATLEGQLTVLSSQEQQSMQKALDLQAELEALNTTMATRIADIQHEAAEQINVADENMKHLEDAMTLKNQQVEAECMSMKTAAELANARLMKNQETSQRNMDALRSAVALMNENLHMWRDRALAAEDQVAKLERSMSEMTTSVNGKGTSEDVQLTGGGRVQRSLSGKALRRLIAAGPRRADDEVDCSDATAEDASVIGDEDVGGNLYNTPADDFATAIGMNWASDASWETGPWRRHSIPKDDNEN